MEENYRSFKDLAMENNMTNKKIVSDLQKKWAEGIIEIGKYKDDSTKCKEVASKVLDELYAFENGQILFKPTRAKSQPFRHNKIETLSYFIGGNSSFPEDIGFALEPWEEISFKNSAILTYNDRIMIMGRAFFLDKCNNEVEVKCSLSYILIRNNL